MKGFNCIRIKLKHHVYLLLLLLHTGAICELLESPCVNTFPPVIELSITSATNIPHICRITPRVPAIVPRNKSTAKYTHTDIAIANAGIIRVAQAGLGRDGPTDSDRASF